MTEHGYIRRGSEVLSQYGDVIGVAGEDLHPGDAFAVLLGKVYRMRPGMTSARTNVPIVHTMEVTATRVQTFIGGPPPA